MSDLKILIPKSISNTKLNLFRISIRDRHFNILCMIFFNYIVLQDESEDFDEVDEVPRTPSTHEDLGQPENLFLNSYQNQEEREERRTKPEPHSSFPLPSMAIIEEIRQTISGCRDRDFVLVLDKLWAKALKRRPEVAC